MMTNILCGSKEPLPLHLVHLISTYVDRGVCLCLLLSKTNNQLIAYVEQ